jgi:hypothetical protein
MTNEGPEAFGSRRLFLTKVVTRPVHYVQLSEFVSALRAC